MGEMKRCSKCGEEHPATLEYFSKQSRNKTCGLNPRCKICSNVDQKSFRDNNHDAVSKYRKRYFQENRCTILAKNKKWADKNKVNRSLYNKKWREENKERVTINLKRYYQENKEEVKKNASEYRKNNSEKIIQWRKIYYEDNKERILIANTIYHKDNRERYAIIRERRRSRKRQLPSTLISEQWNKCKLHFDNGCAYCGKKLPLSQDHFIPIVDGGEYTHNNIIPACRSCNSSKGAKSFFTWYPTFKHYSKSREAKILKYLGYSKGIQQLSLM